MNKTALLPLISLLVAANTLGQERPFLLNGVLVDAKTLEPLNQASYSHIAYMDNGLIAVEENAGRLWGVIDRQGVSVIQPRSVHQLFFNDGLAIGAFTGFNKSYEVLNEKGERLFGKTFSDIKPFENGMTGFADSDGKYGILSRKGQVLIKPQYDNYKTNIKLGRKQFIVVSKNSRWGIINSKNKAVLPFEYTSIDWLKDDVFKLSVPDPVNPTRPGSFGSIIDVYNYYLWSPSKGFLTEQGMIYIDQDSDLFEKKGWLKVRPEVGDQWSLIDLAGNKVSEESYDEISYVSDNLLAVAQRKSGTIYQVYAMIDLQGNLKIDYLIDSIGKLKNGLIPVCLRQNDRVGCGYVDENGQLKIPMIYIQAREFDDDGTASVGGVNPDTSAIDWGLIDKENNILLPVLFGSLEKFR